ncbi:MAG: exopolygalacturonase [Tannerella sp.]|jgi:polygalacturonase|nr:exopolygalacturonase [Tannerella sp.]
MKIKALSLFTAVFCLSASIFAQEKFPDGTLIPDWFRKNEIVKIDNLGKKFKITDHNVINDSTIVQTEKIQHVIDMATQNGGVVIIPEGTYLSGSLFFKPGTHLHLEEGAVLKGSDDISNFPITMTRMEGQTLKYFSALINADSVDGFTISGKGTINGNGLRYWRSFWLRREFNPQCTNMDEMRPRLVYISNCNDVQISGVNLINSPFWTTHLYKCKNVKLLNLHIFSPEKPVKAPSTDAVDIDACTNVLIKNCYMSVNDDAVALKGGKGPWADKDPNNGGNYNIIIEDCEYGFCHGALTLGSESIHDRNIVLRRCTIKNANRLLWLKMRPDTPQNYEYILVEDITGDADHFLYIKPWTQFFDLKGREDIPKSYSNNITMRNINFKCETFFNVDKSDQYELKNFTFENLNIQAKNGEYDKNMIENFSLKNVNINK